MSALANALRAAASSPGALAPIAQRACVTPRQASMARAGKPINAGAYLALCGAVGVDPTDGSPRQIKAVSANGPNGGRLGSFPSLNAASAAFSFRIEQAARQS